MSIFAIGNTGCMHIVLLATACILQERMPGIFPILFGIDDIAVLSLVPVLPHLPKLTLLQGASNKQKPVVLT